MKKVLVLILISIVLSCNSQTKSISKEQAIHTLKEFYSAYMLEKSKFPENAKAIDSLKVKYLTKQLQEKLNNFDYELILNAQDCDEEWISTISISKDEKNDSIYSVCYIDNDLKKCVKLSLVNHKNNYLINDILEDKENSSGKLTKSDIDEGCSFESLKIKNGLKDVEWFNIADILNKTPVNKDNYLDYNKISVELICLEKYNEARIILLEVTQKYPNYEDAWLNLADSQWGFDDKEEAIKSYKKHLQLLNNQESNTDIPARVYSRIKNQ